MRLESTNLPEVLILEPRIFPDDRGFFMESYNQRAFDKTVGYPVRFVQDNHSRSRHAVLRGLHFQRPPHAQGKLVRVISGRVFDVVVDMRRSSPRLGQWAGVDLSADNRRQLWVPAGFAHGFLVLSDAAEVMYKTTDYYSPDDEGSLRWDDPSLAIRWPEVGTRIVISARDAAAPVLKDAYGFL